MDRILLFFLGEMQKCTDETLEASTACKRDNKKIEVSFN